MGTRGWWVVLLCAAAGAQAVDRADPEAVAEAYLAAVEAGAFAAAIELVGEERLRLGLMAELDAFEARPQLDDDTTLILLRCEDETPADAVIRYFLLPGFLVDDGDMTLLDGEPGHNELRLAVVLPRSLVASLALALVDGEWSVDLRAMHEDRYGAMGGPWLEELEWLADDAAEEESPRRLALRRASRCRMALAGVLICLIYYAEDHKGRLPPAAGWYDALAGYPLPTGEAPAGAEDADEPVAVAFNAAAGGSLLPDDQADRWLVPLVTLVAGEQGNQVFHVEEFEEVAIVQPDLRYVTDEDGGSQAAELESRAVGFATGELVRFGVDKPLDEWLAVGAEALAAERGVKDRLVLLFEATMAYAAAHEGRLPGAHTWCDDLVPYLPETAADGRTVLIAPGALDVECSFGINSAYAGADLNQVGWRRPKWLFTETAGCARNSAVDDDTPAEAVRLLATARWWRAVQGAWLVNLRGETYWRAESSQGFNAGPGLPHGAAPPPVGPGVW